MTVTYSYHTGLFSPQIFSWYHDLVLLDEFDYELPPQLIAQEPLPDREASRMLVLNRMIGSYEDRRFAELPALLRGDELMIVNNARVIPARLFGRRPGPAATGSAGAAGESLGPRIEALLVRRLEGDLWEALVRPGRKVRAGERLTFDGGELEAEVVGRGAFGLRQLRLHGPADVLATIEKIGHMPLPPYIRRGDEP